MSRDERRRLSNRKFWLNPPYSYLVSPYHRPKDPWTVDLTRLLPDFLDRLVESGEFSLILSANAIYSSAYIYRLKSEELFEKEEKPPDERVTKLKELYRQIPPIPIGFRPIKRRMNIEELAFSLRDILKQVTERQRRRVTRVIEELPRLRDFRLVSTLMEEDIVQDAEKIINGTLPVSFSSIVKNKDKEYMVLMFSTLLSMATSKKIKLWQEPERTDDFYIYPPDYELPDEKEETNEEKN